MSSSNKNPWTLRDAIWAMKDVDLQLRMLMASYETDAKQRLKARDRYILKAYLDGELTCKEIRTYVSKRQGWRRIKTDGGIIRVVDRCFKKLGLEPLKRKSEKVDKS
jgi:hypothetical protein